MRARIGLATAAALLLGLTALLRSTPRATVPGIPALSSAPASSPAPALESTDEEVTSRSPSAPPSPIEARTAPIAMPPDLEAVQDDLTALVDGSLDGFFDVDGLLDQVLAFAQLPVDEHVDFGYESNDSVAYRLEGTPDGTKAHFLVGTQSFDEGDDSVRALEMEIQLQADAAPTFQRDAWREGPRVHLGLAVDESGRPLRLTLMTDRAVALRASRQNGIDAFEGRFTTGASYWVDLRDPRSITARTSGLIDGNHVPDARFQGLPLRGTLSPDPDRVARLAARLVRWFEVVGGERR